MTPLEGESMNDIAEQFCRPIRTPEFSFLQYMYPFSSLPLGGNLLLSILFLEISIKYQSGKSLPVLLNLKVTLSK